MSHQDSTTQKPGNGSDASQQVPADAEQMDEELSRFAHRLAGFGLGEALDALLARRDHEDPAIQPDPDPEPC